MANNFQITQGAGTTIGAVDTGGGVLEQKIQVTVAPITPVTAISLPLPIGASTETTLALIKAKTDNIDVALSTRTKPADTQTVAGSVSVSNFPATQPVSLAVAPTTPVTGTFFQPVQPIIDTPATLCISVTAATGVAVTATLPAAVGLFHYLTGLVITKYFTVANAASATPIVVTTTNLPGPLAISMGAPLGTVGTTDVRSEDLSVPLKSSVVNTATTIVCPATTGVIWRINVFYYTAV